MTRRPLVQGRHYYLVAMAPPLTGCALFVTVEGGYTWNVDEAEVFTAHAAQAKLDAGAHWTAVEAELVADCIRKHVPIQTLQSKLRNRLEA